jgi:SAM-dependent methyltransferase
VLRGPYQSLIIGFGEKRGDDGLGISTRTFKFESSAGLNHYQGASYVVLGKIFDALERLTPQHKLIDIGSGMGRVLFYAEQRAYLNLIGIERNSELVLAANENRASQINKLKKSDLTFLQADALNFEYPKDAHIYFLFNPFGAVVLASVLARIKACIHEECIVVYMNPVHAKEFVKAGCKEIHRIKTNFYTEAIFYKIRPHLTT